MYRREAPSNLLQDQLRLRYLRPEHLRPEHLRPDSLQLEQSQIQSVCRLRDSQPQQGLPFWIRSSITWARRSQARNLLKPFPALPGVLESQIARSMRRHPQIQQKSDQGVQRKTGRSHQDKSRQALQTQLLPRTASQPATRLPSALQPSPSHPVSPLWSVQARTPRSSPSRPTAKAIQSLPSAPVERRSLQRLRMRLLR